MNRASSPYISHRMASNERAFKGIQRHPVRKQGIGIQQNGIAQEDTFSRDFSREAVSRKNNQTKDIRPNGTGPKAMQIDVC